VPDPEIEKGRQHIVVTGEVPSPINPPSGCVFHTRCPVAVDGCRQNVPELKELSRGHWAACPEI
jgi:oligopeptide/dipeptide ABC transporter ATP-binding protein